MDVLADWTCVAGTGLNYKIIYYSCVCLLTLRGKGHKALRHTEGFMSLMMNVP